MVAQKQQSRRARIDRARIKRRQPSKMLLEPDWEPLTKLFSVTIDEACAMLQDLLRALGGGRSAVCQMLGVKLQVLDSWTSVARGPSAAARRLIWFAWLMVCRPKSFPMTFWEIALTGRTTSSGADPATAGNRVTKSLVHFDDEETRRTLSEYTLERRMRLDALKRLRGVADKWADGGPPI